MRLESTWSNGWRRFFGLSPEGYREVVKVLQDRYVEEMSHVKRYAQHAQRMQYPQFRARLLAIAADEARHGEWLAEKIALLGGKLPTVPESRADEGTSWQYLSADLAEEKHCGADMIEKMQTVRNELPDIAEGLERIFEEGERHQAEIREMLMRTDPMSHLST